MASLYFVGILFVISGTAMIMASVGYVIANEFPHWMRPHEPLRRGENVELEPSDAAVVLRRVRPVEDGMDLEAGTI